MISLRDAFAAVSVGKNFSYRTMFCQPPSLQTLVSLMQPGLWAKDWDQVVDANWTSSDWIEELQGVASDGANWFFSSGGSKIVSSISGAVGQSPIAIYTFAFANTGRGDGDWNEKFVVAKVQSFNANAIVPQIPVGGSDQPAGINHFGAIACFEDKLFADHFIDEQGWLLELHNSSGKLSFSRWIKLTNVEGVGRMGLVAINPVERTFVTCGGKVNVAALYLHAMDGSIVLATDGKPRKLDLSPAIADNCYVQGGAATSTGHLYVASGRDNQGKSHQIIYIFSMLTGKQVGQIDVLAEEDNQELEGICFIPVLRGKKQKLCQIHAVLLENYVKEKDEVFVKSFAAKVPALV